MGVAITLVFALIIGGLFFKRQNESALEELDSLIHSIFNREENPVIRDELKDEYEELIKDIKEQEKALNDKISNALHTDSTGKVTLDPSSNLTEYVNVTYDGTNTHVQIDRDGKASTTHTFTDVLILNEVKTDLLTLIQNNQLII